MPFSVPTRMVLAILLAQVCSLAEARAQAQDGVAQNSAGQSTPAASVADAAKQAREQKKNATSAAKVITDDDLDPKGVKPGSEGLTVPAPPQLETQPPSAGAVASAETADDKSQKSPTEDPLKKSDPAKVAALKEELARAEEDLKLVQRESQLEQDTVFSNPDYQHDTAGKAKLAELQQAIGDKQGLVEELKARLTALQESLGQQPAEPPTAEAPPAEAPPAETPAAPPQA
jgi:hypothetical protein